MLDKLISLDEELRNRLQSLIDALPFYVLIVDEYHRIVLGNKIVLEQLELDLDQIIGEYCPQIIHGSDKPIPECPLEQCVDCEESVEIEFYDEENKRWIISSVFPLDWNTIDGKKLYLHFAQDVTQIRQSTELKTALNAKTTELIESQKKIEEKNSILHHQEKELQKLDKVKKEYITQAAHELKTPLVSIAGYTEYILTKYKDLDPEIVDDLLTVQKNIDRLGSYISKIIDKMRIDGK
jgi:signal transduction histidine kinase